MNASLALLFILSVAPMAAYGQSVARAQNLIYQTSDDQLAGASSIAALKRLDKDVFVYRSLGDFEESGRLARVSFEVFKNDLQAVTAEIEPLLNRLPDSRLKAEISNALDSYRDGAFWWRKVYQPRVVNAATLTSMEITRTQSDEVFLATVPYTVAIHWRQASKYLRRAEEMMNGTRK